MDFSSVGEEQVLGKRRVRSLLAEKGAVDAVERAGLDLDGLLGTAGCQIFMKDEVLTLEGPREWLRLIEDGACRVVRSGKAVRQLGPGTFFGPDLEPGEQVVACSDEDYVCSFAPEQSKAVLTCLEAAQIA